MTQSALTLAELYTGLDRLNSEEVVRRAVLAGVPPGVVARLTSVPRGDYSMAEFAELLLDRALSADDLLCEIRPAGRGTPGAEPSRWSLLGAGQPISLPAT